MTKKQVFTHCLEASVWVNFALILIKSHRSWLPSFNHNDRHSFPAQRIITTFQNILSLELEASLKFWTLKKKNHLWGLKIDFEYFTASEAALSLYTFGLN